MDSLGQHPLSLPFPSQEPPLSMVKHQHHSRAFLVSIVLTLELAMSAFLNISYTFIGQITLPSVCNTAYTNFSFSR